MFECIRVQKAENNRMQLMHDRLQRQAALEERTKRYFMQRLTWENKYRERVQSAIQKCNAGEKRRLGLLESEKRRVQSRLLQIQLAVKTASNQRKSERSKLNEQLEEKLQKHLARLCFTPLVIFMSSKQQENSEKVEFT
ncbi:uncharacterized protein [Zea mays]|uniref:uncharacterized protein n=1 Tax=Zea mays TaxID=4577 RepID=UPI0004DE8AF8|nr:uncharacterized protein LOC111589523 [Zea mays]XP_023157562.1 uncharacterized protein LOC111590895 [Zea mays]|eukprot:XP_023156102.1 uncharacterized protein LOC111589523 [Zea mays]